MDAADAPPPAAGADARLGHRVREVRTGRGVGLRELAGRLQISPATLSAVEHGHTSLSALRLARIAALLEVPVSQLLVPDAPVRALLPEGQAWRDYPTLELDPPLSGALAAFLELGYAGASMRDVGRHAGLSVPGIYHHYSSKHDLLVVLLELTMADLLARSRAARAEGDDDPVTRFRLLVECLALFHTHRRDLGFIGASEMRSLQPAARERITRARREQQAMVDEQVLGGCRSGAFGTDRPAEAARAVVTMCTALSQWFSPTGPATAEQVAEQYVEFALGVVRWSGGSVSAGC